MEGTPLDLRDRALLELMRWSGLRPAQVVALDVDSRPVAEWRTLPALAEWLERGRPVLAGLTEDGRLETALFVSKTGRRLSPSDVRRRLRAATRQDVARSGEGATRVRRTFAMQLLEAGGDAHASRQVLEEATDSTTGAHSGVESMRLRKAYARAHPRA